MHARTLELLEHLDTTRQRLADAFANVPEANQDVRPSPAEWSAGEVLSHLAMIEVSVCEILQKKLRRAVALEILSVAGNQGRRWRNLASKLLDEDLKVEAPDFVVPDGTMTAASAWDSLQASRAKLRQILLAADGKNTEAIVSQHVLLGVLTFEEWFGFVGYHEQRHAAQIARSCA
ncbi:MAG: hypothetical protein ACI89X_001263 [Planctomycetota bacterium]|jgi:hypothetical protein